MEPLLTTGRPHATTPTTHTITTATTAISTTTTSTIPIQLLPSRIYISSKQASLIAILLTHNMSNLEKNIKISQSIKQTKQKRKHQVCKTYRLKIDMSSLSKTKLKHLKMMFVEAKWLYNDALSFCKQGNNIRDYKLSNSICKLDKDKNVSRVSLNYLGSQIKQSIIDKLKRNILSLKNSNAENTINYKSDYSCIELKQYNRTFFIDNGKYVKIQKIPGRIRVYGLKQIPNNADISNARLLNKATGLYIDVVTYSIKNENSSIISKPDVGIDFGCKNTLTLSDGTKLDCHIGESDKLKKLQSKAMRQKDGSNNKAKTICSIRKKYEHLYNKKKDIADKIIKYIKDNYSIIYIQDDNIANWKDKSKLFKDKECCVQHSMLSYIKNRLMSLDNCYIIGRFESTSKTCSNCGHINNNLKLSDRTYNCSKCGMELDRDINAAINIQHMGRMLI